MVDEKDYIISMFNKHFRPSCKNKTAIYGLGKNTKVLLDEFPNCNIVALMDEMKVGDIVWGLPVVSCEDAHKLGVSRIIILAKYSNVPIIYHRITRECDKFGIVIYDINGNKIKRQPKSYECKNEYLYITEKNLKEKILNCDIVSFDIFDTLLMRKLLYPTDIFIDIMNKSNDILVSSYDFVRERVQCEREFYSEGKHPNIYEIYEKIVHKGNINEKIANILLEREIEEEINNIIPRDKMKDIFNFARDNNKKICCTSDMYLTERILKDVLKKNGFEGIEKIFVSCEYQTSKYDRLHTIVRKTYPDKKILHIGDNIEADINSAKKCGIDDTFHINSATQMLEDSAISELLDCTSTFLNRKCIGFFIAKQFNNPFIFDKTKGKCIITSCYQLGYDFIAPLIASFVKWLIDETKNNEIDTLLLGARDGWIIKKVLDIISRNEEIKFNYLYFYASRSACTLAGLRSIEDILYSASLAFSGSIEKMLCTRFKLNKSEIKPKNKNEKDEHYLLRHSSIILEKAKKYRENYNKYIDKIKLRDCGKIGFFDFVSSGTCQLWLESIFNRRLKGFYFMRVFDPKKRHLSINSMFNQKCVYQQQDNKIFDNYFFLENILSSPEPTISHFGDDGECIFEDEKRTNKQIKDMLDIQIGILEYFINLEYLNLPPKEVTDTILNFVRKEYSELTFDYFEDNLLYDEFCQRQFQINVMVRQ